MNTHPVPDLEPVEVKGDPGDKPCTHWWSFTSPVRCRLCGDLKDLTDKQNSARARWEE